MSSRFWTAAGLTFAFVCGLTMNHLMPPDPALAQAPAKSEGRFQISAYASTTGGGSVAHGCYVVDTATGQVWNASLGQTSQKVSERLP